MSAQQEARTADLGSLEELQQRLARQNSAMTQLVRLRLDSSEDLQFALQHVLQTSAEVLSNERTSYWAFSQRRDCINCLSLYERSRQFFSNGQTLIAKDYPKYFRALEQERMIIANDPSQDPRTSEFTSAYLQPLNISAMLDTPVWVNGLLHGVVCHEHVDAKHRWTLDEQNFAGSIADVVAITLLTAERHESEESRQELLKRIAQSQKLEGLAVFAGGVAHDFNNLLMGILGNAGLAANEVAEESVARQKIERITKAAKRAAELTRQLMMYAGKGMLVRRPLELGQAVRRAEDHLRTIIGERAELVLELLDEPLGLEADEEHLRHLLSNLVGNSAESMRWPPGKIVLRTAKAKISDQKIINTVLNDRLPEGIYAVLEIIDDGEGMERTTRERMFDPFFSTKFPGRGLGLAAVLGIVRAHRGGIQVESQPQVGTTVRVFFPTTEIGLAAQVNIVKVKSASPFSASGKLLLVDDEELALTVTREMLEKLKVNVITAKSGREAVKIFREHGDEIEAAFVDLTMPHMDGVETSRALREIQPDVQIILMSGYSEEDISSRCQGLEVAGFLQKPYCDKMLLEKLRDIRMAAS